MKPRLAEDAVNGLVGEVMGEMPSRLERLVEGMESQAFRFQLGGRLFVVRINPSLRGFEKDRWASLIVGGNVPVPRVVGLGMADGDHAYCISECLSGVTLEDLPAAEVGAFVDEVAQVWQAIGETDVSSIDGFGDFDADGAAPARSWREVLEATVEDAVRDLVGARAEWLEDLVDLIKAYERLIDHCPEQRGLIHGDFGSNNVLVEHGRVTAVLDWDLANVGDPLYDVANCYFWASYLPCMHAQASFFDRTLSHLPAYAERVACYGTRIGLEEARETLRDGDRAMAAWALARSRELLVGLD